MTSNIALAEKDSPIAIVGAGIFGLSSAIHLAERGFQHVTVFDKQSYFETEYSFAKGCDAASADANKIIRAAYGDEVIYQNLTFEAMKEWEAWNQHLTQGEDLPPGMTRNDRIFVKGGNYRLSDNADLSPFEKLSIKNISEAGYPDSQYVLGNPEEVARAKRDGWVHAIDPFNRAKDGKHTGYLDAMSGFVYADKACRYALHKAKGLGVKFTLGDPQGKFQAFKEENGKITGIETADGLFHPAKLTIMACGGWTPSLVPEMDGLCETTAGSVATIQIPRDSPLYSRFAPENFPVWTWKMRGGELGNLYGFPRDEQGSMKLGYRGTKYTNPQSQPDGVRSIPITKWTTPSISRLPDKSIQIIRSFLDTFLPELGQNGINISGTRLCWYTDSFDNQYVIDAVPQKPGVMVVTGGSGHAFKFLPIIGRFVADRVEGKPTELLEVWRWRQLQPGQKPFNVLMQGMGNPKALRNVKMAGDEDLVLGKKLKTALKL
ncbi:MAG: hypothetical protein M1834_005714 [Cirrosporium novae-zelandiae]|nr:MAG: hypothetical protein M1834_005714 [Cirrosporium novae-zelandiae]